MTPSHQELAAALARFSSEQVNVKACGSHQANELANIATQPPRDLVICKDGSRSLVGKHTLDDNTECVLKYYYPKNLAKKINYGLRGSRAMRSWIAARAFELLNIPTPAAMLLYEKRGIAGIVLKQSMLACQLAPGIPLSSVTNEATLHAIVPQLKEAFATMATFHISHGDLKANNIIVDENDMIRFIDLDGTTILSPTKKWSELWKRDRKRFLRNWPEDSLAHRLLSETISPA